MNNISGEFADRIPVEIATIEKINPLETVYVDFSSLDEGHGSISYTHDKRTYSIQVYFPINPLSDRTNWLDHEPYDLELMATAAEAPPFILKRKLWVDGGRLKLSAVG